VFDVFLLKKLLKTKKKIQTIKLPDRPVFTGSVPVYPVCRRNGFRHQTGPDTDPVPG
jgi:hypothetical protein